MTPTEKGTGTEGDCTVDEKNTPAALLDSIKVSAPPEGPEPEAPGNADAPKGVRYENRIVAFVDILGFKEIVYASRNNTDLMNQIYNALDIRNDELAKHFTAELNISRTPEQFSDRFHTFSDCIVMSVSVEPQELGLLIFMVFKICRQLLSAGFLSRGGIALGELLHRAQGSTLADEKASPMVFGPAFIDAYNLEANHADGARVILKTDVWQLIRSYTEENSPSDKLAGFFNSHIARADDGPAFVNLFADFPGNAFYNETDVTSEIKQIHQQLCNALHQTSDKPHQFRKNAMLAKEFNFAIATASSVSRYKHLKEFLIPNEALPSRYSESHR